MDFNGANCDHPGDGLGVVHFQRNPNGWITNTPMDKSKFLDIHLVSPGHVLGFQPRHQNGVAAAIQPQIETTICTSQWIYNMQKYAKYNGATVVACAKPMKIWAVVWYVI